MTITLNEWSCKVCNHIVAIQNLLLPKVISYMQSNCKIEILLLLYENDTNIIQINGKWIITITVPKLKFK